MRLMRPVIETPTARINMALWTLVGISVAANLTSALLPNVMSPAVEAALLVSLPVVFAFAHGSINYRFRDMLVFAVICLAVSNVFETIGILTGFPFGRYHFTDGLGPKLFLVPLVIGPAYFGMGYLSWMLACLILGTPTHQRHRQSMFAIPVLASFVMVSWDLSFDPVASTLQHAWIWEQGGSYFGVPLSNFLGWYLTVYVFFQLYALYLGRCGMSDVDLMPLPRAYWAQSVVFYGGVAARIILVGALSLPTAESVVDQAGIVWRIHDVVVVCALVCLFTMVAFTVLGLLKVAEFPAARPDGS